MIRLSLSFSAAAQMALVATRLTSALVRAKRFSRREYKVGEEKKNSKASSSVRFLA